MNTAKNSIIVGVTSIAAWAVISAFSRIYTANLGQIINPFELCFLIFSFSGFVFLACNALQLKKLLVKARHHFTDVLWVNLTTFGAWFFLIYPLKYIDPSIVSTITLGVAPLATLIISRFIYRKTHFRLIDLSIYILIIIAIGYIISLIFLGKTSVHPASITHDLIAVAFSVLVGVSIAANMIYSKRLSNAGFKPIDILTVRFVLLIVASGAITLMLVKHTIHYSPHLLEKLLLDAFTLVIFSLYFMYVGIRYLEPITVVVLLPLMPILVYFFEFFSSRMSPNLPEFLGISLIVLLVISGSILRIKREVLKID